MSFGGPYLLVPLSSLLGMRPGMAVSVSHAPAGFMEALLPLPEGVALVDTARLGLDMQVLFVTRKTEVVEQLQHAVSAMSVLGSIWVCFQPGAEGPVAPGEDFVRLAGLEAGLVDTKVLLLGETWKALRFQMKGRPPRVELPQAEA